MVVAPDGMWHGGWKEIIFNPTAAENDFLTKHDLWTGNTVYFKNAVHRNRWQSVFGAPYLLLKMLIERLSEEYTYTNARVAEIQKAGVKFPVGEGPQPYDGPSEDSGVKQDRVKVKGLEA